MRLDIYMTCNNFCESRKKASDLIKNNNVYINGICVSKPSFNVEGDVELEIKGDVCLYVGRGGMKLEGAMEKFSLDFQGKICADIGSSTGGFTDCMLQNGAIKVYAVDSGKDQLHSKLRNDSRVVCMEGVNARFLASDDFADKCDIVTMDVSFISQTLLYDAVSKIIKNGGLFVSLIKPQFECGKSALGKNGIVKNQKIHSEVCDKIVAQAKFYGFDCVDIIDSPILGGDGNKEFLALFTFNKTDRN